MPSPFPGMNPFLEQDDVWEDFHGRFIPSAADFLEQQLGPNYVARIEVRLYIHELSAEQRRFLGRADVGISGTQTHDTLSSSTAVAEAPMHLLLPAVDIERQKYLTILDRHNRRVVTVIELLSPSNKTLGSDRDQYLAKRRKLLTSTTHFVEIDCRRGGVRPPHDDLPSCDYYVLVSRVEDRPRVGVWPLGLRDRLPVIPIPLAGSDPPVQLDLQFILNRVYDAANYGKTIYQETPQPPLPPDDADWARQFMPQ